MKNLSHFFIFFLLVILFSCKKDDDVTPELPSCRLLKEVQKFSSVENDTLFPYYEYVYENNKMIKRNVYIKYMLAGYYPPLQDSTSEGSYLAKKLLDSLIYDNDGRVIESFHNPEDPLYISHQRFYYNGDKLERIKTIHYYNLNVIENGEESFSYTSDNKLNKSIEFTHKSNGEITEVNKTYTYTGENLSRIDIEMKYSQDTNYIHHFYWGDTTTYGYEMFDNYDDKENPYKGMFFIDELRVKSLSANNFQHYNSEFNYRNGYEQHDETESISEYNESGFPVLKGYTELVYDCDN